MVTLNSQCRLPPDARILVIGGQGDTAILRDFAAIDAKAGEEPIAPYL